MYCIVDIETTGSGAFGQRITEISIFKYDGHKVVDEFTSLVNPQCPIPPFITGLTGIDDAMVRDAPLLEAIADDILAITEGQIFVAHNVNFDYGIIKNQLKGIGKTFVRKKLCTVRLSRQLFPGYHSYSLGKLCSSLGIALEDRHRARGDAEATVHLFHKLLRAKDANTVFKKFLNARSQEGTLPPALEKAEFEKLPESPGIYYFKNAKGAIIYVGKANNIKKRVLGHFYDKAAKEKRLCSETRYLDFEEMGSELLALLRESGEIQQHYPKYNTAQKRKIQQYGLFTYEDRNGIIHLAFNSLKMVPSPLYVYGSLTECRQHLEELCTQHGLCPKYCHLQVGVATCSHYKITSCTGICKNLELRNAYNQKVKNALREIQQAHTDFALVTTGRNASEYGFALVANNQYLGYGFMEKEVTIRSANDLEPYIQKQKNTVVTRRIINAFIRKGTVTIVPFEQAPFSMEVS